MGEQVRRLLADVATRYANEPEFLQAVRESAASLELCVDRHPEYVEHGILERFVEPERVITFRVTWVDEGLHRAAMTALLTARRRDFSLVDCVSFETMRRAGAARAFAFERHFRQQGFDLVP